MRYLILSDIHANREALSAVLARVRRKRWDKAVFLGDLVGYGAHPNQTVEMVQVARDDAHVVANLCGAHVPATQCECLDVAT